MKIEPIFTDLPPVIGQRYKVPTVFGYLYGQYKPWPVLGPRHDDKEIIGFELVHYHLDLRFVNPADYRHLCHFGPPHRHVLHDMPVPGQTKPGNFPLGPVVFRWRKYYRETPVFPQLAAEWSSQPSYPAERSAPWMNLLEKAYEGHRLGLDLICPHRGASLKNMPVVDGCITCPLHGLQWDAATGELRRFGK